MTGHKTWISEIAMSEPQATQSKRHTILLACIGNIFHGDDAFGVEVSRELATHTLPDEVRLVDYGIRGLDLAFDLLDGYDVTIFVDATPQGNEPGTIYVIKPDLQQLALPVTQSAVVDTHGMNPMRVLKMAMAMGVQFKKLLIVGCEPESFGSEEEGQMGLSQSVQAAVPKAVEVIESLITKILKETRYDAANG